MAESSKESVKEVLAGECTVQQMKLRGNFCHLTLKMPLGFPEPVPGQFIMVSCCPSSDGYLPHSADSPDARFQRFAMGPVNERTTLPRPMSIFDYSRPAKRERGLLTLVFKTLGRGTLQLSQVRPGDQLRFLGPLGNGFDYQGWRRTLLVAGGVGFSGINMIARRLREAGNEPLVALGVNTRAQSPVQLSLTEVPSVYRWALPHTTEPLKLVVSHLFEEFIPSIVTSLYPGDEGAFCGTTCDLVEKLLGANPSYAGDLTLVACGPRPMLAALTAIARHSHVKRYLVMLEERMACGLGTCLGCAVQTREGVLPFEEDGPQEGPTTFKRVCTDGPIFNGYRIIWERLC
ncbi:MAG: hypothetical protein JW941_04115 [Candidatus Coatesbacteria bacterium]|nr:hypothetical protein [Candidatus Coatesbacteria bacterium]